MALEAELNYYVNDWLFIAPSSTADTFGVIAERHMAYKHALAEVGICVHVCMHVCVQARAGRGGHSHRVGIHTEWIGAALSDF